MEDASSQAPPSSKPPASSTKRSAEQASLAPPPSPKKLKTPVVVDLPKEGEECKVVVADSDYKSSDISDTEKEESDDSDTVSESKAPPRRESVASSAMVSHASYEKPPRTKRSPQFEHKLQLTKDYIEEFGSSNVDPSNCIGRFEGLDKFLGEWRRKCKLFQKDPSKQTEADKAKLQHVMALVDLETSVKCSNYKAGSSRRVRWEQMFNLLQEYTEIHGTCVVKKNGNPPPRFRRLHGWWYHQRELVRKYEADPGSSTLNEDQYKRLMGLGFVTDGQRMNFMLSKFADSTWEEMFAKLQAFVKEQGHANVPSIPRTRLRTWIELMRGHHDRLEAGKASHLTPERVAQMLRLGFSFQARARLSFDERALQWLEYKTKHGRDPPIDNGTLGQWTL